MENKKCKCGDDENQLIDNCEKCVVPECGCQEFEETYTVRKLKYAIEKKFEIVSHYMQNQTDENWLIMLKNALEFELGGEDWEEDRKELIKNTALLFERMANAVKES